jgi:two-component system, cell cycle sensor histidine kinase and response regulator CckA
MKCASSWPTNPESAPGVERQLRELIAAIADGVLVVDHEGIVCFANPGAERLLGRPEGTLLGKPFGFPIIDGELVEVDVVRGDGSIAVTELRAVPATWDGRSAWIASLHDITSRVRLQEQLRHAQKMEALGLLAGGIAHDFNNLLTVINGYAQLLLELSPAEAPTCTHLKEIAQACQRAGRLTQHLLAFSHRQVMQSEVVDMHEVLEPLISMLRRLIREDVEILTTFAAHQPRLLVDPDQFGQIVLNLAVNARDAMPSGGKLYIRTQNMEISKPRQSAGIVIPPGSYVRLSLRDTGVGMTAATRARIFEPFFTTKPRGKGSGLGLSMVYGIVKQSRGYVWAESEPGEGTEMHIVFPTVTAEESSTPR